MSDSKSDFMSGLLHRTFFGVLTAALLAATAFAGQAWAQTPNSPPQAPPSQGSSAPKPQARVALVIGNSAYTGVTALPNPSNDAKAISQLLNSAGFEVIAGTDLTREEMAQVMQDFAARINERGPDTIALVYYAGHGLQIAGENFLVPVDAKIASEQDVADNTVRLVDVMATLSNVQSHTRVVILDACRNNPFASLGDAGRGLAIVDAPNGSIVAYSTAPGTEAYDGTGNHSPYTSAFLKLARTPNVPIEQFFKRVRLLVNDVTDGRQTPWESSSLTSDFYLFTDNPQAAPDQPYVKPQPAYQVADIRKRSVRQAYDMVIEEDSVEYYEEFVTVYPSDPLAARIRALLAARLVMTAWHGAVKSNTPVAYASFQSKFANTIYAQSAKKLQVQPKPIPISVPTKVFKPVRMLPNVVLPPKNVKLGPVVNPPLNKSPNNKPPVVTPPVNVAKPVPAVTPPVNATKPGPNVVTAPVVNPAVKPPVKPNPVVTLPPKKVVTLPPPKKVVVTPPPRRVIVNPKVRVQAKPVRTAPRFVVRKVAKPVVSVQKRRR